MASISPGVSMSMVDGLTSKCPKEALLKISSTSHANALRLSMELSTSLNDTSNEPSKKKTIHPISLPKSIEQSSNNSNLNLKNSQSHYRNTEENYIKTLLSASSSVLSSLTKVGSGGSQASSELRQLETQRRTNDSAAKDIQCALQLRQLATLGADALGARRYANAAEAVRDYRAVPATDRAKIIAGPHAARGYERARDVLQRTVLDRYEAAVAKGDLTELSELTPLLGMLDLAGKGVGLYLRYSQANLSQVIAKGLETEEEAEEVQNVRKEEEEAGVRISRAEQRRRVEDRQIPVTVCSKLAKVYNAAVTHLRHHLPMVAYALGEADGDAALVQLVHIQVEKRAVKIIKEYLNEKRLPAMQARANNVANQIEEKYITGNSGLGEDLFSEAQNGGTPRNKHAAIEMMDDCGFKHELGTLPQINSFMDELALLLQHTESYDRFIRHAIDEVDKARVLRKKQKKEERRQTRVIQLENVEKELIGEELEKFEAEEKRMGQQKIQEILPSQTQLSEAISEVGGYYSGLERTLLLASMQRAFLSANYPDDRNYSSITILAPGRHTDTPGYHALQTSVVEEALFAAQRSTLRAFATGHTGTASAAVNFCADILGRVLLEVLSRRAETGISMLKPGDGLLPGAGGLGQAALSVMANAHKGLRNRRVHEEQGGDERALMKQRIETSIARSCANLNDFEVAVDYTSRLEEKFSQELESTYSPGRHETEQLRMCIKSIANVTESFQRTSNDVVENLIASLMPRIRSMVNETVGQEGGAGQSISNVMGGGVATNNAVRMNYHLDDDAYEMLQISESYITRLCFYIDELVSPLRSYLAPRLSDDLLVGLLGGASKRLEAAIKRGQFTALGALALDSDIRFFINFAKERFDSPDLSSTATLYKACGPLARLAQIALLMNVDDLEDVLDLITTSKRKKMWDLSLNDAKAFLNLRVDFEGRKVNELLKIDD